MTSESAETPARAGVAAVLGKVALDLGLYVVLTVVLMIGLIVAGLRHEPFQPRFSGPHSLAITLSPCEHGIDRNDALLDLLRSHGSVTPSRAPDGQPIPPKLLEGYATDKTPLQHFVATITSPPGQPLHLTEADVAAATGCRVQDLVYVSDGKGRPEHMHFPPATIALLLVGSLLAAIAAWVWRRPGRGVSLARGGPGAALAIALLAAISVQGLAWLATALGLPLAPSNRQAIEDLARTWPALTVLVVVVGAPLAEEAFFRGVLLRRFMLAGRPFLGLLLTSSVFALAHEVFADGPWTQTIATTIVYAATGLLFGAVYLRTGRLWAAILAHVVANAIGLAMLAYSGA